MKNVLLLTLILIGFGIQLSAKSNYKLAEQDSLALVAFYNATSGDQWISNQDGFDRSMLSADFQASYWGGFQKWLSGPVNEWYGVKLGLFAIPGTQDSIYRVIKVAPVLGRRNEGQNQLSGYLPKELGLLTQLEEFKVNGNTGLQGTKIPDEVYHSGLKYFDVEGCNLTGDISDAIKNCPLLQEINMRYNQFSYMPAFDFIPESTLRQGWFRYWFYSCELPFINMEKTVEYFYSISPNAKEFWFEARDNNNVGDAVEVVAPLGSSVELVCNEAGSKEEDISYQWFKDGLSKLFKTKKTYAIASVKNTDYGLYTVKISNEFVKSYDQNSNYGDVFTKGITLVPEPLAPVITKAYTAYNGQFINIEMSKQFGNNLSGYEGFTVNAGERTLSVTRAEPSGRLNRTIKIFLNEPIGSGENISLSYSGTLFADKNGGVLEAFTDSSVLNLTRAEPKLLSAETSKDGLLIDISFSGYIDETTIAKGDFQVSGLANYEISNVVLNRGMLDDKISANIRISLAEPIEDNTEEIKLSIQKGGLAGLYSGTVDAVEDFVVINNVVSDNKEVSLRFFDGSGNSKSIFLAGSWLIEATALYDDGTNGDEVAGDNIWTATFKLADDDYNWDIVQRTETVSYDTVKVVDEETGAITLTITPKTLISDSVISSDIFLNFSIAEDKVSGDTIYSINDKTVIFKLKHDLAQSNDVALMGIDNDWSVGRQMHFDGTYFVDTLTNYTTGDIIYYNFRDSTDWENVSTETREYVVTSGENVVINTFGVFSTLLDEKTATLETYYDYSSACLVINNLSEKSLLHLYDLNGRLSYQESLKGILNQKVNLEELKRGIYLVQVINQTTKHTIKIIIN